MGINEAVHQVFIDYRDNLGDRDVYGRKILRCVFRNWDGGGVLTGSGWLRIGTVGGHL